MLIDVKDVAMFFVVYKTLEAVQHVAICPKFRTSSKVLVETWRLEVKFYHKCWSQPDRFYKLKHTYISDIVDAKGKTEYENETFLCEGCEATRVLYYFVKGKTNSSLFVKLNYITLNGFVSSHWHGSLKTIKLSTGLSTSICSLVSSFMASL